MKEWLIHVPMTAVDWWLAAIPRPMPNLAVLQQCKIISHRGEHDNREVMENTLRAYEIARAAGVWGIEGDIRWTADLAPVIIHDPDAARVFGQKTTIGETTYSELRRLLPLVPSVAEVVAEFGGNTHLMLELKAENFPQIDQQKQILAQHLSALTPGADFHLLALDIGLFEQFDNFPRSCCLPVSIINSRVMSKACLAGDYGGFTGHFLLLNDKLKLRHEQAGQPIGTGFVRSGNCLFRELNRGVEWIFTNDATKLQQVVSHALK